MTPRVAPRASGTPALADARQKLMLVDSALREADIALQRAADALPGARRGLEKLLAAIRGCRQGFDAGVVRPFDEAILEELLHQAPAPRAPRKEG